MDSNRVDVILPWSNPALQQCRYTWAKEHVGHYSVFIYFQNECIHNQRTQRRQHQHMLYRDREQNRLDFLCSMFALRTSVYVIHYEVRFQGL